MAIRGHGWGGERMEPQRVGGNGAVWVNATLKATLQCLVRAAGRQPSPIILPGSGTPRCTVRGRRQRTRDVRRREKRRGDRGVTITGCRWWFPGHPWSRMGGREDGTPACRR